MSDEGDKPARRHAIAAGTVVAALLLAVLGPRVASRLAPSPTSDQCTRLVDRYLEQAERQKNPEARGDEIAHAVRDAQSSPDRERDVADCRRRLTRAQVECGLAAPNVDELERCVQ